MIAEIGMGLGSLKAALDLTKSLNAANTQAAINDIRIGLQEHILDAQAALSAAREASSADAEIIRDLKQKIVQFENWEREKGNYELKAIGLGAFAYVSKAPVDDTEPQPWFCTNCFENGKKSVYMKLPGSSAQTALRIPTSYECAACKSKVIPS